MSKNLGPLFSPRLLCQASFAISISMLIALLVSQWLWPIGGKHLPIPDEMLDWNIGNILFKPREKGFYILTLIFGTVSAYLFCHKIYNIRILPLIFYLMVFGYLFNHFALTILQHHDAYIYLLLTMAITVTGLAVISKSGNQPLTNIPEQKHSYLRSSLRGTIIYLSIFALITGILAPRSFIELASRIGVEMHVASFLIGPSLYFLGDHLIPGVDYFTQYSLGMGWVFSFFLGNTFESTMLNYVKFLLIVMWLFYVQLFLLLHWLYRSWIPACIITLLSLILLFHTTKHFFDPSSSVLRYPLLIVSAWLLSLWIKKPNSLFYTMCLSLCIASSLFLNTETGIITLIAISGASFLASKNRLSIIISLLKLYVISLIFLFSLLLFTVGPRILSTDFLYYLIEPLLIYGKIGFGGWPIAWNLNDLNWLYNLLAPIISIGTLALIARTGNYDDTDRPRLAVLAFFILCGLMMLFKYVNMSIIAVWQMNALGLLIALGWWGQVLAIASANQKFHLPFIKKKLSISSFVFCILMLASIWLACFSSDSRNPSNYGLQSWIHYPSWVRSLLYHQDNGCSDFSCVPNIPNQKDIALIQSKTKPGEQVAIIDLYDWAYLASANRAPLMFFLPSVTIFTKHQLFESTKRLKKTRYLFLPKDRKNRFVIDGALHNTLVATFYNEYEFDEDGERLTAWRRKSLN